MNGHHTSKTAFHIRARIRTGSAALLLLSSISVAQADDVTEGKVLWYQPHTKPALGKTVNCATCHTSDLRRAGAHVRTGKRIEPMAPSVNHERLRDPAKIAKWFRRNCKWTWGRLCTREEQRKILAWIRSN